MARPFKGEAAVSLALATLQAPTSVEQLRQAQAVVLPLRYGLSLKQTAEAMGVSPGWASRLRNQFMAGQMIASDAPPARGGRHRENFTHAQEAQLLQAFLERASRGGILVVGQIKPALEAKLGRPMALSSVYNLLHRHGWRKLAPDKRRPQSDPQAQIDWKKNSPKRSPKSATMGPKGRRSG